jgi:outer membrane receptor protein involved in Fe transport
MEGLKSKKPPDGTEGASVLDLINTMTHISEHNPGSADIGRMTSVLGILCCLACSPSLLADDAAPADQADSAGGAAAAPATTTASTTTTSTTTTTAPATPAAPSDSVTTLEKYTVTDVPVTEQILPTVRPISSVYGDDRSIIDIPRSVTSVNKAWMDDRQVKNAMDFGQFATGVYSAAQYGIPAVPFIRGDLAQIYLDGQVMIYTRNSVPPSFNEVEALDIVKGPGSAVYGPQGEGAGGYVNFVTKQPYLDSFHFDVTATFGSIASGRDYFNPDFTFDFGGPIDDKLAYRVSYESRYGDGYYKNDKNRTQDIFVSMTYHATKNLKFDWWGQYFSDKTNEVSGVNRVTQAFIWNGTYVTGPTAGVYGDDTIPVGQTQPTVYSGVYGLIQPTGTVKLPDYDVLVSPQDIARASLSQTQLVSTLSLSADSSIVDHLYLAVGDSNKTDNYGYDEYTPIQEDFQNRLEYHTLFDIGRVENSVIAGGDFRYQRLVAYTDYSNEPFSYYDLSVTLDNKYPAYYASNNTFGGEYRVPGTTTYSATDVPDNQDSHIYDSAVFVQDDVKFTSMLSSILGFREDYIKGDSGSPSMIQVGQYNDYFQFVAFSPNNYVYTPVGSLYYASGAVYDPSYFSSLVFKPTEASSVYFTYDHVDAVQGTSNFGGINVSSSDPATAHQQILTSMTAKSTLYEVGYKQSMLHNTLYFGMSAFQQVKFGTQLGGADYLIKDNGLEVESVYQPSKAIAINGNFTFQDATAFSPPGSGFYQQTGNYLDAYPTNYVVPGSNGQYGTGVGSPNFTSYFPPGGRMRAPGIPQVTANFFVEYKFPDGFGFGLGPQIVGRQYANDQDTLHIPGQYSLDGYLFYKAKRWDVRVNVRNMTNQRLVDTIDVSFAGNDQIFVRAPVSASLTLRFHY